MKMEYYKNAGTGEVYAYDMQQIEGGFVEEGLVKMTDAEIELHLNPPISPEQRIEDAQQKRLALRAAANAEIEWRQDAVDVGEATLDEETVLAAWRKYRVLLMRVDLTAPVWPVIPDSSTR